MTGDYNALTLEDYSKEELESVATIRYVEIHRFTIINPLNPYFDIFHHTEPTMPGSHRSETSPTS